MFCVRECLLNRTKINNKNWCKRAASRKAHKILEINFSKKCQSSIETIQNYSRLYVYLSKFDFDRQFTKGTQLIELRLNSRMCFLLGSASVFQLTSPNAHANGFAVNLWIHGWANNYLNRNGLDFFPARSHVNRSWMHYCDCRLKRIRMVFATTQKLNNILPSFDSSSMSSQFKSHIFFQSDESKRATSNETTTFCLFRPTKKNKMTANCEIELAKVMGKVAVSQPPPSWKRKTNSDKWFS